MFVQGHDQKGEQKHRTKNFAKLPNHLPLLTMVKCKKLSNFIADSRQKCSCSRRNFVVLPKQALLELSPLVRTDAKKTDKNLKDPSQP